MPGPCPRTPTPPHSHRTTTDPRPGHSRRRGGSSPAPRWCRSPSPSRPAWSRTVTRTFRHPPVLGAAGCGLFGWLAPAPPPLTASPRRVCGSRSPAWRRSTTTPTATRSRPTTSPRASARTAQLARVRGGSWTRSRPRSRPAATTRSPRPGPRDSDATVLRVTAAAGGRAGRGGRRPGEVRLTVERDDAGRRPGPRRRPGRGRGRSRRPPAAGPGRRATPASQDYAGYLLDQRIRAELRVADTSAAVTRLDTGRRPVGVRVGRGPRLGGRAC